MKPTSIKPFDCLPGNAFVTGAASGIGAATAIAYAAQGCVAIFLVDISAAALPSIADHCRAAATNSNFRVFTHICDVTSEPAVIAAVAAAVHEMGTITYACNAAGISGNFAIGAADVATKDWDAVMAVNARGLFLCVREQLQAMRTQPPGEGLPGRPGERGSIVNISSIAGLTSSAMGAYGTSKYAAVGISGAMAAAAVNDRVRVNCVCPGLVETPMSIRLVQTERYPPRPAQPEEVAEVVVFLSSFRASFVSGQAWAMNGAVPFGVTEMFPSGVGNVYAEDGPANKAKL